MKNIIKFVWQCLTRGHRRKKEFKARLKAAGLSITQRPDTSIYFGCVTYIKSNTGKWELRKGSDGKGDLIGEFPDEKAANAEFDRLVDEAERRGIDLDKVLDEVVNRKAAYIRWSSKFDLKFHLHFDGELILKRLSRRDGTPVLKGAGGHNHSVIDENIKIRRFLSEVVDDNPFDVLISIKYRNGQWIDKVAKSTMFPKNWDINRVKEEIALVFDKMKQSGRGYHQDQKNRDFIAPNSNGSFKIKIEFDEEDNLTNAYPWIRN